MKKFLNNAKPKPVDPPASNPAAALARPKRDNQFVNWTCTVFPQCYPSFDACYDAVLDLSGYCRYCCFGIETCPDTKREHLQGFFVLEKRMRLTELKKIDNTMHFEPMRGTLAQNYAYCTKEDKTPIEFGTKPDFDNPGEREKNRWTNARKLAMDGHWDQIDDHIYVSNYGALRKIRAEAAINYDSLPATCGFWLYGVPASGKSYDARYKYAGGSFCLKSSLRDAWFDGYVGQHSVIIEDVDPDSCKDPECVKNIKCWTDKWPFSAAIKGSMLDSIRPDRIIITSNFSIEECFPQLTGDNLIAFKRRFTIVNYLFPYTGAHYNAITSPEPGNVATFNSLRNVDLVQESKNFKYEGNPASTNPNFEHLNKFTADGETNPNPSVEEEEIPDSVIPLTRAKRADTPLPKLKRVKAFIAPRNVRALKKIKYTPPTQEEGSEGEDVVCSDCDGINSACECEVTMSEGESVSSVDVDDDF